MNSIELRSAVQSDACATELQHTAHVNEKNERNNTKKPMLPAIDLFPSVFHFDYANQSNMSSLLENMKCIKSNISSTINDCYEKPMKAALLKESIHQALSWILMSYRNLPKDENSSAYLESMSDLLAMYIDMELRASKRGQEQFSAISTRLICCLYTYLDNSTDYMVDTLIKIRHMSHLFHIILDPIMEKILKNIPQLPKQEIVYVRYLLGFRLWKMINSDLIGKKQIRQTAVSLLGTAPSNLPDFLTNYYNNCSGSQMRSPQFLMKHKFDVKACCTDFINFCKREAENCPRADEKINHLERVQDPQQQVHSDVIAKESSSIKKIYSLSEKIVNNESNNKSCALLVENSDNNLNKSNLSNNLNRISISDDTTSSVSTKESIQFIKPLSRRKLKKSNDIIIIDITDEDSAPKITRKKNRKLIPWLEKVKKQNLQRLNGEKKEKKNDNNNLIEIMKSPAEEILKCLLMVNDDNDCEQKKIESNLYTSFNSWISFNNKNEIIAMDYYQFFDEEASEDSSNSEKIIISSPIITDLSIKSVLNSDRINSSNSDELLTDNEKSKNLIKNEEENMISRLDDNTKTDLQEEAVLNNFEGMSIINEEPMNSQLNESIEENRNIPLDCSAKISNESSSSKISSENLNFSNRTLESNIIDFSTNTMDVNLPNLLDSPSLNRPSNIVHTNFFNSSILETNFSYRDTNYNDSSNIVDYTLPKVKLNNIENETIYSSFQENADALSVLASVCAAQKGNNNSTIKVKDYARWKGNSDIDQKATLNQFTDNSDSRIVNIYPEDAFDKVALQVEVISTSDGLQDNITQSFRETSNVILNGETVVLMQKSPNSNVYVINKAKENNKTSDDETFDDEKIDDNETQHKGLMIKSEIDEKLLRNDDSIKKNEIKDKKNKNLYRQNVKQEFINCTCGIPNCSLISHDNSQLPYFSTNPELCVPYHKHVPLNLPINSSATRCNCLACTYEVVTHCHQYIHPNTEPTSFIENNSYFIQQQTSAVQEHERSRISNLYDDQLCLKIEKTKTIDDISMKFKPEIKYQREINNKLPLKKRLKAIQKPYDMSIKMERNNYSIELQSTNVTPPEIGATVELTTTKDNSSTSTQSSPIENRHDIRRDYDYHYQDDQSKDQRRLANSQLSNVPHYHDSRYQRDIKTTKGNSPLKRLSTATVTATTPIVQEQTNCKKARKSTKKQTRSSSRKIPKINYNYSDEKDLDPPYPKRKRRRTSR